MVKLTMIARARDGLPLAEGLDADKEHEMYGCKSQAKALFKKIAASAARPPPRMSLESGAFTFHYLIEGEAVFLTLVEKAYPRRLAHQYLDELAREFASLYGPQIGGVTRPYAFIKFDTFIQKTKKLYQDTRTSRNLAKLNADLAEVHAVMTRNIADVLGQGERLDRMAEVSGMLSADARQLAVKAKDLAFSALMRQYLPWAVVGGVLLLFLLLRAWF
jgi:vesicle transport protein SEC22